MLEGEGEELPGVELVYEGSSPEQDGLNAVIDALLAAMETTTVRAHFSA